MSRFQITGNVGVSGIVQAITGGNLQASVEVDGKPVCVRLNVYIKK